MTAPAHCRGLVGWMTSVYIPLPRAIQEKISKKFAKMVQGNSASPSSCLPAEPKTITGEVVKIADADTLTVLDGAKTQHRIRLAGSEKGRRTQLFSVHNWSGCARRRSSAATCLACRHAHRIAGSMTAAP
jgi:endonuclease YncB( thermonuclease family)